jgi:TldD protein
MASINRRDFIKITGTGLAMASMPYFLQGSTINHSSTSNEYFARFGIDEDTIRKVMTEALNSGGDYCDLYFQNTLSNSIRLQDNIVSAASTSVQLGVGIRVIKGNQTEQLRELHQDLPRNHSRHLRPLLCKIIMKQI